MAPGEDTVAARTGKHFVGSTLAGRNVLYERFSLTSAARNRINHHLRYTDRSRAYAPDARGWRTRRLVVET